MVYHYTLCHCAGGCAECAAVYLNRGDDDWHLENPPLTD